MAWGGWIRRIEQAGKWEAVVVASSRFSSRMVRSLVGAIGPKKTTNSNS